MNDLAKNLSEACKKTKKLIEKALLNETVKKPKKEKQVSEYDIIECLKKVALVKVRIITWSYWRNWTSQN